MCKSRVGVQSMKKIKKILLDLSKCTGCRRCELVCSFTHEGRYGSSISRIQIMKLENLGVDAPIVCRQCESRPCVPSCPKSALSIDETTGATLVSWETCIGCGICIENCPIGALHLHPTEGKSLVCDLCGGSPACVEACDTGAIRFESLNGYINQIRQNTAFNLAHSLLTAWKIDPNQMEGVGGD